jgi:hypothetical protein
VNIPFEPNDPLSSGGTYTYEINFKQTYWNNPNYLFFYLETPDEAHAIYAKLFLTQTENYWYLVGGYNMVNCENGELIAQGENMFIDNTHLFTKNVWSKIFFELNFNTHIVKISGYNNINYTDIACFWFDGIQGNHTLARMKIYGFKTRAYFDFFDTLEVEGKVWGVEPIGGTEITDLNTIFIFNWQGLENWDSLSVVFQNKATGIFTDAKEFKIDEMGNGEKDLPLKDFNFDKNGKYNFYATASRYVPEVMSGMYLTGKYSYEWSEDLVDPEYWLMINIGGLTPIFEMSNFTDWYTIKSKFDTPTEMFSAIAGFFSPIFSKIGEFGNRIQDYFNVNESYSQGYEMGKAIPYFGYFVGQISLFLGGFPILKWLFIIILLLTGIFIFRLILKFIPFIG